jgi:predicted acetyltransferase
MGKINIVKMSILSKAIYRSNAIPIKITTQFFTDLKQPISASYGHKKPRIATTILDNKRIAESLTIPDFKLYYKAIVIKTARIGIKKHVDQ